VAALARCDVGRYLLAMRLPVLALAACLLAAQANAADSAKPLTIAVIPKGTTHEFWKSVEAGARQAEAEYKAAGRAVRVIWKGPLKEDDRTAQIDVVQTFVTKGVSGIVLAPLDAKALAAPVEQAVGAGIPVVVIDSGLASDKQSSFVATDNRAGGRLAGERLLAAAGGAGKIILLRYVAGSASTEEREAGFLDAVQGKPGVEILSSDQHGGVTRESALTAAQNLLNRYGTQVTAVFTPNESSTAGMALALEQAGLAGKVIHVGFDASAPLIAGVKAGRIHGLVVQDPKGMGYLGVKTLVARLDGETVQPRIDTPVKLVTPENLGTPEIQALLGTP
jgi:ribose transport system substrate-binding protein